MSEPAHLHSQRSGFTDSTHTSSSSASSRYGLDEGDATPVLVYEYRGDVMTLPQRELAERVNKDPSKRVTRKPIPRGTSSLDLYGSDLCLPDEKDEHAHKAAYYANLASVPVPRYAYWRRLLTGSFDQLYIISRESRSDYDSQSSKISPSSSWKYGSQEDVQLGASA